MRIAIIGAGAMGQGLFYQAHLSPEVKCVALADLDLNKCIRCVQNLGLEYSIVKTSSEVETAIANNKIAISSDGRLIAESSAQVLIESSSAIQEGLDFCQRGLATGKHLFLMNAEVDLTYGPQLLAMAAARNLIYSSCDGDQHGVIKNLVDEITAWGFKLVLAGNIKGYLDRRANPSNIKKEAEKRSLDYQMATAFTDGTKLNIEMALVANALNLSLIQPGMLGPRLQNVSEVIGYYNWEELRASPSVDYILGAQPDGGVFVVGYQPNSYQQKMLAYYKMGDGPYYLFYRPYHLCHIESITSLVKCLTQKKALLQPTYGMRTNVFAYAKKTITAGEILDGVGGYSCYGLIEMADNNPGIPICQIMGSIAQKNIAMDAKILAEDVSL